MKKLCAAAFLLAACASKPAPVTAPPDPRLADLQASMTELLERIDVMNDRITRLEKAAEEKASVAADSSIGSSRPVEKPATTPKPQPALRSAQIAETYRNAIVLFTRNRFPEARVAFQRVFDADPSGELADNALFWIGETYFAAGDFNNAIRFYKRVGDEYGDQNKAPDAMYKLALAYEKTGDLALARTTLREVIARYPYSAPAASAKSELNRIKY